MQLTDAEKAEIKALIDHGEPLPDKYRFALFKEPHEAELIWPGKTHDVTNAVLPFQSIEQIDEPRAEVVGGQTLANRFVCDGPRHGSPVESGRYASRPETIVVTLPDATGRMVDRPQRTGGYIFENEWQSFRTRKDRKLELESTPYEYPAKGKYKVAVKVIDIFGNDTTKVVEVSV